MAMKGFFLLACALGVADALVARGAPAAAVADPAAQVLALHKQLETISVKWGGMLNDKNGALAHAKVGPAMKVFLKELNGVLSATSADKKVAAAVALPKLLAAKQGLASLMGDLNSRQTTLMKEDNAQRESLLLGVLMTKQKEPMDKQLEILKDEDFAPLEVAKALLAKHDDKALYVQAAGYLDAHANRKLAPMMKAKPGNPLVKIQSMLETRLHALEHESEIRDKVHQKKVVDFDTKFKKASKYEQRSMKLRQKRDERQFKKQAALRKHDIKAMSDAVAGVKKGDMKAVEHARQALQDSLKAMQDQTGGFLYLIQMHHRLMKRDCPYCAAQCVDKCHTAGKPYVQCLTDCADAGK